MLTYMSKFLPNFATSTTTIRELLKKDREFHWQPEHEQALSEIKNQLVSSPVLQFYDVNEETIISVDASKSGLGAVLLQNRLPCAYASKAMTDTQMRYAQIEKELLAICFGVTRFNDYIYGKKAIVETDHLPLIPIFKKPLNKCPARLQRMLLMLQKYDLEIRYKPGKEQVLADALSRAYIKDNEISNCEDEDLEAQVCLISQQINATEKQISKWKIETKNDPDLIHLKKVILDGWPNNNKKLPSQLSPYIKYKSELTINNDLIFKGQCLVVPHSMRTEMVNRIHYSHLGINKCVKLAQESLFWPGMVNQIKQKVSECHLCLKYSKSQVKEPLTSHQIPNLPWNKVGSDLFMIHGINYLMMVDYYSKFVEIIDLTKDITNRKVILTMKEIIARHGIPLTLVSDEGTQFTSTEFKNFAESWEFELKTSSPKNSQSNGMAERHIQTTKTMFKKIIEDKKDLKLALLNYNNTPIFENKSPAELLMSRKLRSILPHTIDSYKPKIVKKYANHLETSQANQKHYYDAGKKVLKPLEVNTNVYVQLQPKSVWTPAIIVARIRDRTYRVRTNTGGTYVRNRKFIKLGQSENSPCLSSRPKMSENKPKSNEEGQYYIDLEHSGKEDEQNVTVPVQDHADQYTKDSESSSDDSSDPPDQTPAENQSSSFGRIIKKPVRLNL